jgi:Arc/MetJ-type ribon-helix-helix transcriptional regulator
MPPKLDSATDTERVQIVAPVSWIERVEEWRRSQARIPSRSEAIRILVDLALDARKRGAK